MIRLFVAAVVAIGLWSPSALPQGFPSRPVHLVVPFPAGGTADLLARSIAQISTDELPVFVIAPQYQKGQKFNNPTYDNPFEQFLKILHTVREKHPIDPLRMALEGFSMGGNFTCAWADARVPAAKIPR